MKCRSGWFSRIKAHIPWKSSSRKYALKKKLTVMESGLWSSFTSLRINFILYVNKEFEQDSFYKPDKN